MYTRDTELRRLQSNDVNRLAETLGFDGGRKLMETIPKHWSNQHAVSVGESLTRDSHKWNGTSVVELKYKPEQVRLIEEATRQTSGCYFAEILIQEWSTSGRKHERPTVGFLLQLLIKADLWNAADFVAEHFLNEPAPERPLEGPGAKVDISIPTECFGSVADFVNDSVGFPDTETINDNAIFVDGLVDHNRDYYTKVSPFSKDVNNTAPKPPPRTRSARQQNTKQLLHQEQQLQPLTLTAQTNKETAIVDANGHIKRNQRDEPVDTSKEKTNFNFSLGDNITAHNIPELSDLLLVDSAPHSTEKPRDRHNEIPMLSILCCNTAEASGKIPSMPIATSISNEAIPLGHNATTTSGNTPNIPIIATTSKVASPLMAASSGLTASLPLLTELNMESASGEVVNSAVQERSSRRSSNPNQLQHQTSSPSQNVLSDGSRCSSLSNDSFDDDDENDLNGINMSDTGNVDIELADGNSGDQSLPNLSVFGRQSPNNDSSLTTVTCTSGENSFELSLNESSSTSTTDPTAQRK